MDNNFKEHLEAKILYNPEDSEALILLGALEFVKFHQVKPATKILKKALQQDPQNINARFWLAVCSYYFLDYQEAEKILIEAINLDRTRADCLSLLAYLNWDRKSSLENSLSYLKQAIHINPDWPMLRVESIYEPIPNKLTTS
ncbi:MAG TPA: tetratricopeptide repeat protein [Candidatus Babeliaceae bacterium]|nr:tetratricopeptide repeat protein [Candidatus Babeliaceae bacterium]